MKNFVKAISVAAFSGSMLLGGGAHAGLISNGGFETGDFNGWQQSGSPNSAMVASEQPYMHSGDYAAFFGSYGELGSISQTIQTTTGQAYKLGFWLQNLGGSLSNEESVAYFAVSIDNAVDPAFSLDTKQAGEFTRYELAFTAAAGLTDLTFDFRHDDAFWILDDVSVDAVNGAAEVPEPGSLALVVIALLAGLPIAAKRRAQGGSQA